MILILVKTLKLEKNKKNLIDLKIFLYNKYYI